MKQITLIGIGMGNPQTLTLEGKHCIDQADIIIGGQRMVESLNNGDKPHFVSIDSMKTAQYIHSSDFKNYVILLSGDTGFYSGATHLLPLLNDYEVTVLPGISSVSYFSAKLKISWEDAHILSLHGRKGNVVRAVKENNKTFILTDGKIGEICATLVKAGLGNAQIYIGENLSYPKERIVKGIVKDLIEQEFASISVAFIINPNYTKEYMTGIPEEEFIRGKVPMTKSEVRVISISKLKIKKDSILYDIGAGTGSVSIEMALLAGDGMVYAIEQKEEATLLIQKNKEKFGLDNLEVIKGCAPEILVGLKKPDMAFIGGSNGNMKEILRSLLDKNKSIRIVVNAIALETLTETLKTFQDLGLKDVEVVQASISKTKEVGKYHMLMGQNPVFIISGGGNGY